MKRITGLIAFVCYVLLSSSAFAQEHWTEGPVWEVSFYRTTPGNFDDYMKYLRTNYLPQSEEAKKQGLIVDRKVFVKTPTSPKDWDVCITTLHASFAKALDYSKEDDDKSKDIAAKHYKTEDEEKQQEMAATRYKMREYIGTEYVREVNLRPMP